MQRLMQVILIFGALCLLGVALAGPGYRWQLWSLGNAFGLLKWSAYSALGVLVLLLVLGILSRLKQYSFPKGRALLTALFALPAFCIPYLYVKNFEKTPTFADASTDLENPPQFVALRAAREATAKNPLHYRGAEAAEIQQSLYPNFGGLTTTKTVAQVIQQAEHIAHEMGLDIAVAAPAEGMLEATDISFWFGFKDDIVLRAAETPDGYTHIDMRSASRVGNLDGGVNIKRLLKFLDLLEKRLKDDS